MIVRTLKERNSLWYKLMRFFVVIQPPKQDEVLRFVIQIARGMRYLSSELASERVIVHRDLAARNCMLVESSYVGDTVLSFKMIAVDFISHSSRQVGWQGPSGRRRFWAITRCQSNAGFHLHVASGWRFSASSLVGSGVYFPQPVHHKIGRGEHWALDAPAQSFKIIQTNKFNKSNVRRLNCLSG